MTDGVVPILQGIGLTKVYGSTGGRIGPRSGVQAVSDVDLSVHRGETLSLVGESGCGKTTTGRMLVGLTPASAGTILVEGQEVPIIAKGERRLRRSVQFVFQDPIGSLNPRMTIRETLAEPISFHQPEARPRINQEVQRLAEMVGLSSERLDAYPHEFSGGQRQRVAIARALGVAPKVIVCDEPVSALDVSVQAQVLNLLQNLQERLGIGYLFISHAIHVVRHISDRVAVMYGGRIIETGKTSAIFNTPHHPYTMALLASAPSLTHRKQERSVALRGEFGVSQGGCSFRSRCPHAVELCALERPKLLSQAAIGHFVACHRAGQLPSGPPLEITEPSRRAARALNYFRAASQVKKATPGGQV